MISTDPEYDVLADSPIKNDTWQVGLAFDRQLDTGNFIELDESLWGSTDILSDESGSDISGLNFYQFRDVSARVKDVETTRRQVNIWGAYTAIVDVTFDNTDGYFTPDNPDSTWGAYILPRIPIRIFAGYDNELLPHFIGLTDGMPEIDEEAKTAKFTAYDIMRNILETNTKDVVAATDIRSDEVIANVLASYGLSSSEYVLDEGSLTIPYLYIPPEKSTKNLFEQLCQAELARCYVDETGVVRFQLLESTLGDTVATLTSDNSTQLVTDWRTQIANVVRIRSQVRSVKPMTIVYDLTATDPGDAPSGDTYKLPASTSDIFLPNADLDDPCSSISAPQLEAEATTDSYFLAVDSAGDPVTSGVTVDSVILNNNNYVIKLDNANAFDVWISKIVLYGTPATVDRVIDVTMSESGSVAKYGKIHFGGSEQDDGGIDNDYIGNEADAEAVGVFVLTQFAEPNNVVQLSWSGNFALQNGDPVLISIEDLNMTGIVLGVENKYHSPQVITVVRRPVDDFIVLGTSVWAGNDKLGGL